MNVDSQTRADCTPVPNHQSSLWVLLPDIHYPEHDKKAIRAVFDFIRAHRDQIEGVIFTGDNLDCQNVSRHTKGLPRLRKRGGYQHDIAGFRREVLLPLERLLKPDTTRVFIEGNHEAWLSQALDEMPEFEGALGIAENLRLKELGYKFIPQGGFYHVGKATVLHGDQIGSGISVAKKLVDVCCETAVMGHVHTFSAHTKVSHVSAKRKWLGITLPTLETTAPNYAKGRPNTHICGFGIIEKWRNGFVNIYIPLIFFGRFSFGGRIYGGRR